jgi:tetratricopeptide (TPR) repeat protein
MTGLLLKNQGMLFLEKLHRYNEAVRSFSQSWSNSIAAAGPDGYSTLESEDFLAQAYSQLGQTNRAAELFRDVSGRWIKLFPFHNARNRCLKIADWFARHGDSARAGQLAMQIRDSIVAQPVGNEREFSLLSVATSVTQGWPAAAELCRARFDDFPDSLATWRSKAAVFSYVGDVAWYRKAAERAIALAPNATNWESRVTIIQTASRGPFQFSAEHAAQCDALIAAVDRALPTASRRRKQQALRNVAALELRLGRPAAALKHLNESWEFDPFEIDRASTYFLESLCLHSLEKTEEAGVALRKGEAQMEKWLPEPVSAYEGFLDEAERYAILLHREAQRVITSK